MLTLLICYSADFLIVHLSLCSHVTKFDSPKLGRGSMLGQCKYIVVKVVWDKIC